MNLKTLIKRSQNLLLNPSSEFVSIAGEKAEVIKINKSFVAPVAAFVAVFALIGSAISNINASANSFIYIGINALIVFLLVLTHSYLSGKLIGLLAKNIDPGNEPAASYALSTYSQLPFFLILALTKLFPSLIFLIFLGLYSGILFHTGSSNLTRIANDKRLQFTLLSILIMFASFLICSELFTLLYSEILDQFSTFAS
jgi:hypothetical protein